MRQIGVTVLAVLLFTFAGALAYLESHFLAGAFAGMAFSQLLDLAIDLWLGPRHSAPQQ